MKTSEQQRRKFLRSLGARITEMPQIPNTCFLLSRQDRHHDALFLLDISDSPYAPKGTVYIGLNHRPVIDLFLETYRNIIGSVKIVPPKLELRREAPEQLIALLKKGVNQYVDSKVTIELQQLSLDGADPRIKMVVRRIRSFKYRQISYLERLYERFEIPFCAPAGIYCDGTWVSSVVPPVLELHGDTLVAIEGNTRMFHLDRKHTKSTYAFVVKGVTAPLPGIPVAPREALLTTYQLPIEERMQGHNGHHFRSIERAARPKD